MKLFHVAGDADEIVLTIGVRSYSGIGVGFPDTDLLRLSHDDADYHFRDQEVELDENGCVEVQAYDWDGEPEAVVTLQFLTLVAYRKP